MKNQKNDLWVWGYVLKEAVPSKMEFVAKPTQCSLETAAEFVGANNVVFLDSTSNRERLDDLYFQHVAGFQKVICGLQHHYEAETARKISEFSMTHPNITGAVIDDFLDEVGPSKDMTVAQLKEIYEALKSVNPALKLYVVRYSRQNLDEVIPYLPYIDAINFWVWVSTEHYWHYQYHQDLLNIRRKYNKPILQGMFLHDYGDSGNVQSMEFLKLQVPRMGRELKTDWIEGIVLLQNGWFDTEDHREQVMFLRDYFAWFHGTRTIR